MDVHTESISIALRNSAGKVVTESVTETKASDPAVYRWAAWAGGHREIFLATVEEQGR